MEAIWTLLIKNQSLLGKLRARATYCSQAIKSVENDSHKLYGPLSGYWDTWQIQVEEMYAELMIHIENNQLFLNELREFIFELSTKKSLTKSDRLYLIEVSSLTEGKIAEQQEILALIDHQLKIHRDLTKQLEFVEAIDNLEE